MLLPPRGRRDKTKGYVAHRLFEVSVAHDVSPVRPGLRLFGFSAFRPADVSAFRLFGFSAFGFLLSLTVALNPDLKPCLIMGKPEVKLTI